MKKATQKAAILLVCLFNIAMAFPAKSANCTHVVISEVQISGGKSTDDFIELYNPTDKAVSLDGYRLVKRTKTGTSDTTIKSFSSSDSISAFGFFLWANSDYTDISVLPDAVTSQTIASDNGVALRKGAENTGEIIDSLGWGEALNIFVEGSVFSTNPSAGKSIERKPGAEKSLFGNAEDTGNNSVDFALRESSDPQNRSSPIEIPEDYVPPENLSPIADCGEDRDVYIGSTVSFDGSASSDLDGSISSYSWDFGDGGTASGVTASHVFSAVGEYSVRLSLADDKGATGEDICVINAKEPESFSDRIFINEIFPSPGSSHDWDGDGSADSSDEWVEILNGDSKEIDLSGWSLDDVAGTGSAPFIFLEGAVIEPDEILVLYKKDTGIVFNNTGDSVVLKNPDGVVVDQYDFPSTATDKSISRRENTKDSSWASDFPPTPGELNVPPENKHPFANAGQNISSAKAGEAVSFNGSSSYDEDGQIVLYLWNFGDGGTASGVTTSHVFNSAGTYQVTLTVKDNSGATGSNSINVSVSSVAITPTISSSPDLSDQIKLTEILPNPVGEDSAGEYIKIFNFSSREVNLKGWSIDDEEGGSKPYLIDYECKIGSQSRLIFKSTDTKIALNNDSDEVRLFDPNKKLIDKVAYSGSSEGAIYVLNDGKWSWSGLPEKKASEEGKETVVENKTESISSKPTQTEKTVPSYDLEKIKVKESAVSSLATSAKNLSQSLVAPVEEDAPISLDYGADSVQLASSDLDGETPTAQSDFSMNSMYDQKEKRSSGVPLVIFSSIIATLFLAKSFISMDEIKRILQNLRNNSSRDVKEFEDLFR